MIKIHSMKKLNIKIKNKNCILSHSEILNIYIPKNFMEFFRLEAQQMNAYNINAIFLTMQMTL